MVLHKILPKDALAAAAPVARRLGRQVVELANPWNALDVIKAGWTSIDAAVLALARLAPPATVERNGSNAANRAALRAFDLHHRLLDVGISSVKASSLSWPGLYYKQGFGDTRLIAAVLRRLRATRYLAMLRAGGGQEAASAFLKPVTGVQLMPSVHGRAFASVLEGSYVPPSTFMDALPPSCATGRFQLITPTLWGGDEGREGEGGPRPAASATEVEMAAARPIVVLLAGTGEHGFRRRRHLVAYPLARLGLASLIVEIPFYGTRRPRSMVGSKLGTLVDLPLQGGAVIEEARALVAWLNSQPALPVPGPMTPSLVPSPAGSGYGAVVLAGVSMGGLHAAMTACTLPASLPVGVASWMGPPSAAAVYTQGLLAHGVDWAALAADVTSAERGPQIAAQILEVAACLSDLQAEGAAAGLPPHLPRSPPPPPAMVAAVKAAWPAADPAALLLAQRTAASLLEATDLLNFGTPARPDAAVFATAASDEYVPAEDDALQAMWAAVEASWPGSKHVSVRGGHVSASIFATDAFVDTCVDVVRRLRAGPPPPSAAA